MLGTPSVSSSKYLGRCIYGVQRDAPLPLGIFIWHKVVDCLVGHHENPFLLFVDSVELCNELRVDDNFTSLRHQCRNIRV